MEQVPGGTGLDTMAVTIFKKLIPLFPIVKQNGVEPVIRLCIFRFCDKRDMDSIKKLLIQPHRFPLVGNDPVKVLQLGQPDGGVKAGETQVVAGFVVGELPGMRPLGGGGNMVHPTGDCLVIGDHHAASAGGDEFVAIETEDTRPAKSTGMTAPVKTAQRFRRILNQHETVIGADCLYCVDSHRMPEGMHRNNNLYRLTGNFIYTGTVPYLSVLLQKAAQTLRRHAQGLPFHIHEYRRSSGVDDGRGGGSKTKRLGDHLVPGLEAAGEEQHVECRGAVHQGHGVFGTGDTTNPALQVRHEMTDIGDVPGIDALGKVFLLIAEELRAMEQDRIMSGIEGFDKGSYCFIIKILIPYFYQNCLFIWEAIKSSIKIYSFPFNSIVAPQGGNQKA